MNRNLEKSLAKTRNLSESDQKGLAELIDDFVEQANSIARLQPDLKDPAFRSYAETALSEGEDDIRAGRVRPAQKVFEDLKTKFKRDHGL